MAAESNAPAPLPVVQTESPTQPPEQTNTSMQTLPTPEPDPTPVPTSEPPQEPPQEHQPEPQLEPQHEPQPVPHHEPPPEIQERTPQPHMEMHEHSSLPNPPEGINETTPVPNTAAHSIESTLPPIDHSLPAMDTSGLASFDSAFQSSAEHDLQLPAIDTDLPTFDSALPAIGTDDIPTMDDDHTFGDDHFDSHSGSVEPGHSGPGSMNGGTPYDAPSNGYQYAQNPDPPQQSDGHHPPPQAHSQHQFQAQPQPQQSYQHQSSDMYSGFSSVNSNPANNGQGQPGQMPQAPIGSPMPPISSMGQYMTGYPSNVSQQGGRHKKEVKRRTKTGCLTCRKRRIKCDEGHPVCRNCVKSKRECLGYDPVFRPTASAPSAIQPAPNPPPSLIVNHQGPPVAAAPLYPSAPPGYMPASSQPFAPSLQSESPSTSTDHHHDHRASVDTSITATHTQAPPTMQASHESRPHSSEPVYKASKNLHVNDLIALRGIAPPAPHPIGNIAPSRLEEIQAVFLATYAPAIDKLLEVRWYSEKALPVLMADSQLMADYSALISAFNDWNLGDHNTLCRLESFEASIIWRSMVLCRQAQSAENGQYGQDWNLCATAARLDAIEALLSWNHLDTNHLSRSLGMEAASPPNPPDQFLQRQLDFWSELGEFLTLHDNEASSAKQIDDTLGRCRHLLDTYENRDIIYSIAITRHLGQRWADFPNSLPKVGYTNEKEFGTKLFVAKKFIEEEAEGKGTTQIYKRVCCMAVRSWWAARE
ncbi:transcriptional regulator family: Fungal Specific TF [Penicillium verhagenii]|uniref:transcriptional regulator family: Fungal Specific TF n=1 Tax=Penicillium verhagenii TaxID=1562060 RepID=UPI0025456760|nr:transcriptional regulator family: Fungal Specific TF [Penicillium verhagenii]KAJ5934940.1 transcriptional regulator family: Fungal Specific TF [Penicillium verhagenii]